MRMQVQSLASLNGLRIQHCHELWCRLQAWLGSRMAVGWASSCSSESPPTLGTSICCRCSPKKTKKKEKRIKNNHVSFHNILLVTLVYILVIETNFHFPSSINVIKIPYELCLQGEKNLFRYSLFQ